MPSFQIDYIGSDHRQYARVIEAADFAEAERQCGPDEQVSGQILQVVEASDALVADMRLRIGEALSEVANG